MDNFFDDPATQNNSGPEFENEVVVTAIIARNLAPDSGHLGKTFHIGTFRYGTQYGTGTTRPDPFTQVKSDAETTATEIVVKGVKAIKIGIDAVIAGAKLILPAHERKRLEDLSDTLDLVATGLEASEIDLRTARTMVQGGIKLILDQGSGLLTSALMTGIGAAASALTPSPAGKGLVILGFGALGFAIDESIGDTKASEMFAKLLTDALFEGAGALARTIENLEQRFLDGLNVLTGIPRIYEDKISFEVLSNGNFGEFDGIASNGHEYDVSALSNSIGDDFRISSNPRFKSWNGPGRHEPPRPDDETGPASIVEDDFSPRFAAYDRVMIDMYLA